MDAELKKRWVAALRSGKYKQGEKALYDPKTGRYCCLGVLCDLVDPACIQLPKTKNEIADIRRRIGSENCPSFTECNTLACKNDRGQSFKQIAKYIEQSTW